MTISETGATLTIPEGVTIVAEADDDKVDYILIQQGAKIVAEGTAENPIVMTATKKEAGAWGGIHICGKAHSNVEGGTGKSEIGDATYGGNDDADNSGVLKYLRIEYSGYAFDLNTKPTDSHSTVWYDHRILPGIQRIWMMVSNSSAVA